MPVLRTVLWVLIFTGLFLFSRANWEPGISVRVWSNLVVDTRLPAVIILSFLLGFLPMWLVHRIAMWRSRRLFRQEDSHAGLPRPVASADPQSPAQTLTPEAQT